MFVEESTSDADRFALRKVVKKWLVSSVLLLTGTTLVLQCVLWAVNHHWDGMAVVYSFGRRRHFEHVIVALDRAVWRIHRFHSSALEGANWSSYHIGPLFLSRVGQRGRFGPDEPIRWRERLLPTFEQGEYDGFLNWTLQIPLLWTFALNLVPITLCLATVVRMRRRRSRAQQGLCEQCGYDLRGSSGRCPECGQAS